VTGGATPTCDGTLCYVREVRFCLQNEHCECEVSSSAAPRSSVSNVCNLSSDDTDTRAEDANGFNSRSCVMLHNAAVLSGPPFSFVRSTDALRDK
jgi:hypothetical protein